MQETQRITLYYYIVQTLSKNIYLSNHIELIILLKNYKLLIQYFFY